VTRPAPMPARGSGPLLGPETISWRVNREPVIFAGAGRALLLQVAHPLVAAGVAEHSDYEQHPWRRLYRTLNITFQIAFADGETSRAAANRLQGRHRHVTGTAADGQRYSALDPALLTWVWATLVDTSLMVYERCFAPLSAADRESFYGEQKRFAIACGVPLGTCPESWSDFVAYFARMVAEELRVTEPALVTARAIDRPNPWVVRPLALPLHLFTAGLLPPKVRDQYGFPWSQSRQRLMDAAFASARLGVRVVPRRLREVPAAMAGAA
jgi:uncharacterized protein (DUF2236 family)